MNRKASKYTSWWRFFSDVLSRTNKLLSTLAWYSHTTSRLLCVASLIIYCGRSCSISPFFSWFFFYSFLVHLFTLIRIAIEVPFFMSVHSYRYIYIPIYICMTEARRCVDVDRTRDRTIFIVFRLDITYQFILLVLSRLTMLFTFFLFLSSVVSFILFCLSIRYFIFLFSPVCSYCVTCCW